MKKFKIGGKQRGICFGMLAIEYYCEAMNGDIEQLDKIFNPTGAVSQIEQSKAIAILVWAAMIAYCEINSEDIDFSLAKVKQWVGDMDQDTFNGIIEEYKKSKFLGKTIAEYYFSPIEDAETGQKKK